MNEWADELERELLEDVRESLIDWALSDIKKAVECGIPRLGFVGIATWIDQVARLYSGKRYESSWKAFIDEYLPERSDSVHLFYDGLRNALLHEYGTRGVALKDEHREEHFRVERGVTLLHLGSLIAEFEGAFDRFYADLTSKRELRRRVVLRGLGLLRPVRFQGALSASASPVMDELGRLRGQAIRAFASATAPSDVMMLDDSQRTPPKEPSSGKEDDEVTSEEAGARES